MRHSCSQQLPVLVFTDKETVVIAWKGPASLDPLDGRNASKNQNGHKESCCGYF